MTGARATERHWLANRPGVIALLVAGTVVILCFVDVLATGLTKTHPRVEAVVFWTPLGVLLLLGLVLTARQGKRAVGWGILAGLVLATCIVMVVLLVALAQFAHEIGGS